MRLRYIEGQTPINDDELEDLKLSHISNINELNIWELENINKAVTWAKKKKTNSLNDAFNRELHKQMFSDIWNWAGKYRKTNKNIGVDKSIILEEIKKLYDDTKIWIEHKVYEELELALRFHHRLVSIHAFPNGNGRHARLITDILIKNHLTIPELSWGDKHNLSKGSPARQQYISALQDADRGNISSLMLFAK